MKIHAIISHDTSREDSILYLGEKDKLKVTLDKIQELTNQQVELVELDLDLSFIATLMYKDNSLEKEDYNYWYQKLKSND